jgi:hypothetical protein
MGWGRRIVSDVWRFFYLGEFNWLFLFVLIAFFWFLYTRVGLHAVVFRMLPSGPAFVNDESSSTLEDMISYRKVFRVSIPSTHHHKVSAYAPTHIPDSQRASITTSVSRNTSSVPAPAPRSSTPCTAGPPSAAPSPLP